MQITEKEILKALSNVNDPDLKKDLVSLGMIKNLDVSDKVRFEVELTTPACPLKEKIKNDCIKAIRELDSHLDIEIQMTSNVSSRRSSEINVLPNVKNIIAVASGKGGVGKSTVTVNLAYALAEKGAKVGILDADIHGPSIPTLLGLKNVQPKLRSIKEKNYILPIEKHNIKVLSIGMLVDEKQAIVWRGPMVSSALRQLVEDVIWGKLDYLLIDLPPGTGDVHLSLIQFAKLTGAVIVTTPQNVALADARKGLGMFTMPKINVPVLGVIENMAYFKPADNQEKKYYIFGKDGGKELAKEYDIPFLGELPLVMEVRERADIGDSWNYPNSESIKKSFHEVAGNLVRKIAVNNANFAKELAEEHNNLPPIG